MYARKVCVFKAGFGNLGLLRQSTNNVGLTAYEGLGTDADWSRSTATATKKDTIHTDLAEEVVLALIDGAIYP